MVTHINHPKPDFIGGVYWLLVSKRKNLNVTCKYHWRTTNQAKQQK